MRHLIYSILISLLAISCGHHDNKQKEPETKVKDPDPVVNKADNTQPANNTPPKTDLVLTPQDVPGNLGQVTFSQKEKTVFYYNQATKKGAIVLNGTSYVLDKYVYDSKTSSYSLSGSNVIISAPNCKYKESKGEDCGYGKFSTVIIVKGPDTLKAGNVEVQDCPAY